jgi:FkbM family methyltransferase
MIGLTCDPFQTSSLGLYGEWAHHETEMICSLLKPGDVALDVGANIGTITIAMAKRVGRNGMVFAFEPQRAAFLCLCGNVALTHCINHVRCFNAAVGDNDGFIQVPSLTLDVGFNVGGMRLDDPAYADFCKSLPREDVPLMTIDAMQFQRVNLIKIDVEAMESKVLAGARETVKRCRPAIVAEALYPDAFTNDSTVEAENLKRMLEFFWEQNYTAKFFISPLYTERNSRFCEDNIFPGGDRNIVAFPNETVFPEWFTKLDDAQ